MARLFRVLSIDGGGIRGVIPATVLTEIERRTGKPISRSFDLIAGTSTGGILALALTAPNAEGGPRYTARQAAKIYEEEGGRIFTHSVWHKLFSCDFMLEEKYPSEGIESVLSDYLGETRLKDALTDVLISSYEIEHSYPLFFWSKKARERGGRYDWPMWHVGRATSAAPTFFEPHRLAEDEDELYYTAIDGGIFANNPAMCAYVEAICTYNVDRDDILLVSLGTGEIDHQFSYEAVKDWGTLQWVRPILGMVLDGVSRTVQFQLETLLPGGDTEDRRFYRFQAKLDPKHSMMDNATQGNIQSLKEIGQGIIADNEQAFDRLCKELTRDE
jgi:patatin-like phospholipase/acyl hydrolase